ncbi:MAG: hypothetical protein CMO99_05105 [Woeseiaceae bacterium]|nr:hypothetical protein [Woeseiaceae bacterium]|tara:strand:- start:1493 stop:2191 length:699 start_codon:yes stop_codon:yes gene_type:complete
MIRNYNKLVFYIFCCVFFIFNEFSFAHGVAGKDANFLQQVNDQAISIFVYLGAKHMVTGYDHLLYLCGVIFFLNRLKDIAIFVSLFAVGHSITLLWGVLTQTYINPYIIDSIIGLSIIYKALENLGEIKRLFLYQPNPKLAVFCFGLVHGLGLASKLQDFLISENGLVINIISFNIGVEIGQIIALVLALFIINLWRNHSNFYQHAKSFNLVLIFLGFILTLNQLGAFFLVT